MASRATIRDVAGRAGVSISTVSKVLNGRGGVSRETVSTVEAVARELGYHPSLGASSLRSLRTNVLGVLVADLEPFSTEVLKGVAKQIRDSPYELLVYSAGGRVEERVGWERRHLSRLGGTLIDGALLVTPTVVDADAAIPIVAVDPHTGDTSVPTVAADNLHGARLAVRHLVGLGHRRIALLAGRPGLESGRLRQIGYEEALREAGLTPDPALIVRGDFDEDISRETALAVLRQPDPPTAVFAGNDASAIGVLAAAGELGLSVPGDLSVVGFDNIPDSRTTTPPLTTVEQPIQQMGRVGAAVLLDLLQGRSTERRTTLDTHLIVRASTGPARR